LTRICIENLPDCAETAGEIDDTTDGGYTYGTVETGKLATGAETGMLEAVSQSGVLAITRLVESVESGHQHKLKIMN
jgi:hypothetical protein